MDAIPSDIRQADEKTLAITWSDGKESRYDVRRLRLACPCAGCVDEMTGVPRLDPAAVPVDVKPVSLRSVGNYAIAIVWSDGHDSGIYSFKRLREIG